MQQIVLSGCCDCAPHTFKLTPADRPLPGQTELVELTAELMSGAGGAHIGYEACASPKFP